MYVCVRVRLTLSQAPEILEKRDGKVTGYSKAVDLWSMGVILYVLYVKS